MAQLKSLEKDLVEESPAAGTHEFEFTLVIHTRHLQRLLDSF